MVSMVDGAVGRHDPEVEVIDEILRRASCSRQIGVDKGCPEGRLVARDPEAIENSAMVFQCDLLVNDEHLPPQLVEPPQVGKAPALAVPPEFGLAPGEL